MSVDHPTIVRVLLRDRARLFAYIWAIVRDVHMAEDVLQEVSLLAVDKSATIHDEAALPAWLRSTARFRAMHAVQNARRGPVALDEHLLDMLDTHWAQTDRVSSFDMLESLRRCLSELTPRAREMVRMRYVDALSGQAIASKSDCKIDSVYKSLSRIHRALAECMQRHGVGPATDTGGSQS
ncbi:MAG: sigma-70 family RNA polymerase sigma factor [Planctomycetes bacterium]|nr:sigma-70 family RNA polymerase sigma factor [Planctomycetota bacterium]